MTFSELTSAQKRFLAVLEVFAEPVPIDIAATLSSISAGDLHSMLFKLAKEDWLINSDDNLMSISETIPKPVLLELDAINTRERLSGLLENIKSSGFVERIPQTAYHRLLIRSRHHDEAAELAYQEAVTNIENAEYDAALQNLYTCFARLEDRPDNSKKAGLYISATLKLSGLAQAHPKTMDLAEENLIHACELADQMGDRRNKAFISLYQGFFLQNRILMTEAMDFLESGLAAVSELAYDDIAAQAADFNGYYNYCRGLYREASGYFEQAMSYGITKEVKELNTYLHFPIYFAYTAAFNGQFYRAVGVLESTLQSALSHSNPFLARFCRANLGTILLMMGKKGEAYEHLEACLEESSQEEDLEALVWTRRALAWYYFMEGDPRRSYAMLHRCLAGAEEIGSPHPFYSFPWNLELLFEFHKAGYKPMRNNTFEEEMKFALNGINIMMRGVAYRIRAKEAEIRGESADVIRSFGSEHV